MQQLTLVAHQPDSASRSILSARIRELMTAWNDAPAAEADARMPLTTPTAVGSLMMAALRDLEQEELHVLLLDTKNYLIRDVTLYRGTVNTTQIRIAELFREAIRENAVCVVLCHNHPSGSSIPSPQDVTMTRDAVSAGDLLDIPVLDHLIVGRDAYTSLRQRGLGFEREGRAM